MLAVVLASGCTRTAAQPADPPPPKVTVARVAPQEVTEWDEFTGRLAGNRIMVATGHSFRGTTLKELHPPHIYEKSQAEFLRIVTGPTVYRCRGPLFRAGGHTVDGERIVLPLAEDGSRGDGLLGASEYPIPAVTGIPFELISENAEWYSI